MQEPKLHVLDREECLRLLTSSRFGRLAVRMHDGTPAIRPVNYVFDHHSQSVVFRTARGSNLHGWLMDGPAAFEIDGVDINTHSGWSVIVSGVSEEVKSPAEIDRLQELGVLPWARDQKPLFVRLRAFTVSGRRLQGGSDAARS
jgi:nitroimidazol reductase NimA-like FMN-containing flavoprotein (pyridoxamine 5'-phosphate oxidase superfamily)